MFKGLCVLFQVTNFGNFTYQQTGFLRAKNNTIYFNYCSFFEHNVLQFAHRRWRSL